MTRPTPTVTAEVVDGSLRRKAIVHGIEDCSTLNDVLRRQRVLDEACRAAIRCAADLEGVAPDMLLGRWKRIGVPGWIVPRIRAEFAAPDGRRGRTMTSMLERLAEALIPYTLAVPEGGVVKLEHSATFFPGTREEAVRAVLTAMMGPDEAENDRLAKEFIAFYWAYKGTNFGKDAVEFVRRAMLTAILEDK